MPTLELPGARLAYEVRGKGPLVVQLHGLTSSRARDRRLGLDLGRALEGHRVLRYDARGHGESTGVAHPAAWSWARLADDLLALLEHVQRRGAVHGVGPSMGTGTLLHAALRSPGRFASLTLVTPPTAWATRAAQADTYRRAADLVETRGPEAFPTLGDTAPVPPALAGVAPGRPAVDGALLPTVLRGAATADLPPERDLAGLPVPTLVLAWTDDPGHPLSTATRLHELIPDSRLVVARTPGDVLTWPALFADHVARTR